MSLILFFFATLAVAQDVELPDEEPRAPLGIPLGSGADLGLDGYVDVGWFDAAGDGVAYRRVPGVDVSRLDGAAWLFAGDPWANAVNSLGESADLGTRTTTTLDRTDALASGGMPSFLVNQWHQGVSIGIGDQLLVRGAFDFAPRQGVMGDLGDVAWVDQAFVQWRPGRTDWQLAAGKVESVFNSEWWYRQAPDRYGITPSIIARYTTGTPLGVRASGSAGRIVRIAASVTNGSPVTERFGHYSDQADRNGVPTGTARVGGVYQKGTTRLAGGVSGLVGVVDGQPELERVGSQLGADAEARLGPAVLRAEIVRVRNPGDPGGDFLVADGWVTEASVLATPWLRPLLRVDRRVADLRAGPNLYRSDVVRTTGAIRFDVDWYAIFKVEYLHLRELGPLAEQVGQIPDDVFTTSAIVRF